MIGSNCTISRLSSMQIRQTYIGEIH